MAEQLGFHEGFRNGGAVDRDERLFLARAFVVNRFRNQVLAGSALALNEDGCRFTGRNLAYEAHQLRHLRRGTDDFVIARAPANLSTKCLNLVTQTGGFERILDGDVKLVKVDGLAYEVVGAQLERGLHIIQLRVGRDHDDGANVAVFL